LSVAVITDRRQEAGNRGDRVTRRQGDKERKETYTVIYEEERGEGESVARSTFNVVTFSDLSDLCYT